MASEFIKENNFEPAPGGGSGALNYQTGYGTPSGGNLVQDPQHFASSDKTSNHFGNETGSLNRLPDRPDRKSSSGAEISPAAMADKQAAAKPLDPAKAYDPQVNQLFKKKVTPSPDEILQGLQYELGNMVKKDKAIAKQTVLKNLKSDPTYYSRLGMLNIDDKKMNVTEGEQSTFSKTKNVLDQMLAEKKQKVNPSDPNLEEIMKGLWQKRHGFKRKE